MKPPFHCFDCVGVELEYMIVDCDELTVRPICDAIIHAVSGTYETEVEHGVLSWSNELVLHVIELKTNGPTASLDGLAAAFSGDVAQINAILEPMNARLMPTAMHPWMDPHAETHLWPHDYNPVYEAFNRIFDCRGHGWANLQSTHVNLPFCGDDEFGRLHAAIRVVLPLLPALAASSPICEGRPSGFADGRLEAYRHNADRVPRVAGRVIPEPVFTIDGYHAQILEPLYADIAPHDPNETLHDEWLNARGAIARFDRDTIEIRVLDIQECPAADLAIIALVQATIRALVEQRWSSTAAQQAWAVDPLADLLEACIRGGDATMIDNAAYLRLFGLSPSPMCAGDVWRRIADALCNENAISAEHVDVLRERLEIGSLSDRILRSVGPSPDHAALKKTYRALCDCLADGRLFRAP